MNEAANKKETVLMKGLAIDFFFFFKQSQCTYGDILLMAARKVKVPKAIRPTENKGMSLSTEVT
jgi:hypothetical protein